MRSSQKLHFLYFGRLDDEKGFGMIVQMLRHFLSHHKKLPFVITVFGAGKYEQVIKNLSHKDKNIHYFGFQSLEIIKQHAKQSEYILMPSLFLETFGLSALNASSRGIPVVGYAKWWLEAFVLPEYDIGQFSGSHDRQLLAMIEQLLAGDPHYTKNKSSVLAIAEQYDFDRRFVNFQKIFGGPKKILLVTDFVQKLGGIETYVHDIAEELRLYGYTVRIIGGDGWKSKLSRLLCMSLSLCNIPFALYFHRVVAIFKPDVIRYHSVLRHIGWLPLATVWRATKSYIMLHDLWYVHPYPHAVQQLSDVALSSALIQFVRSSKSRNPMLWLAVVCKWCIVRLLRRQFRRMRAIFVPSAFMQELVSAWTGNVVTVLPHFIQK